MNENQKLEHLYKFLSVDEKDHPEWKCPKCNCNEYNAEELIMKRKQLIVLNSPSFITISCMGCGYTEMFRTKDSYWLIDR